MTHEELLAALSKVKLPPVGVPPVEPTKKKKTK